MELDPQVAPSHTSDKTSFSYISVKDRWPVIVTGAIDDVSRAVSEVNETEEPEKAKEGKAIVEKLAKLKYEMQHDRPLTTLEDDGKPDIKLYNDELAARNSPNWYNVSWLYAECYLYRRMATAFALSSHWKRHDVFARQKMSTFKSSRPAVLELATKYKEIITELQKGHAAEDKSADEIEKAEQIIFSEMMEICLWGNATDLSLLTSLSYEDIQKLQGAAARKASEKNIIANDLGQAFKILRKAKLENPKGDRRVDIVLDNAGFELFVDLILAGYLLEANLATQIVLHPKDIPWFVSDVTPKDFADLLSALASPQSFYSTPSDDEAHANKTPSPLSSQEESDLQFLFQHWQSLYAEGKLLIRPNAFWTHAGGYWRLPTVAPALAEDLKTSELVIFKGDLNYRKLTGDVQWDPVTPFVKAIGPMGPGSGIRVLALRTCKADVVVGLKEGEDERLRAMEGGGSDSGSRKWAWSGKWAVIQFSDGKQ